jgi:hypothetical protein
MNPLCQRGSASCGACCGLYNRADLSRRGVREALTRRTAALRPLPRTAQAFQSAAARLRAEEAAPLFPLVRVCPLLGWLDEAETRVGCLAHPLVTGGPDLRDCGVYDVRTCESFFCPSHSWLSEEEAALAADACAGDPYLYGLVVTDVQFLRAALAGVARLSGARVRQAHLGHPPFRAAFRALLALKEEPVPRIIDYAALGRDAPSPLDALLLAVGADPRSGNDLDALEEDVGLRLTACAAAFP